MGLLMFFLIGVLVLTYETSRSVVMDQADTNSSRVARQVQKSMESQARRLAQRAKMITDHEEILEYIFILVNVDAEAHPLKALYRQKFAWLPVSKVVILSKDGRPLLGGEHTVTIGSITARHKLLSKATKETYYTYSEDLAEMVTVRPIYYREQYLGILALTQSLDETWMETLALKSGSEVFFVDNGSIIQSTVSQEVIGKDFTINNSLFAFKKDHYLVRPIKLVNAETDVPQLWLGVSEKAVVDALSVNRNIMLIVIGSGCIVILILGSMIIRNFNQPIHQLNEIIQDVGQGRFPDITQMNTEDELSILNNHVFDMIQNLRDKQKTIDEIHAQLEEQATTDALTGLYNRRYLYDLFPKMLSEASRFDRGINVVLCDLDHFKVLNDQHGHVAGDAGLVHFRDILKETCRKSDFLFRVGGEEFLIISVGEEDASVILGEKIRSTLESRPLLFDTKEIRMTVSIGAAYITKETSVNKLSEVVGIADNALYEAKNTGRNRVVSARTSGNGQQRKH